MRIAKYLKALIVVSLFAAFAVLLSGCAPTKAEIHTSDKSPEGVVLEDYLPENTMMMFAFNTQDEDQKTKLDKLKSYFPQEDFDKLFEEMIEEITVEMDEVGLSYKEDIEPILSDKFRMLMAMSGDMEKDDPDVYVAFTVAEKDKATSLLEKVANEDDDHVLGNSFGAMTLDNEEDDMYLALYKDTILITNVAENRHAALKRMKNNENSLLSNKDFMNSYKELPKPNLGIAFINVKELFTELKKLEDEEIPSGAFIDALFTETFALLAEDEGLKMIVQVAFDENAKDFNLADFPYEKPYMFKDIPGERLVMYVESYGFKDGFELQMDMLANDEEARKEFRKVQLVAEKALNIDTEEDLLNWMDKGFALVVQRNSGIVPAISIYVDTSSEPEKAQKIVDLIDAAMQQAVEGMRLEAPEEINPEEVINKDIVELGKSEIHRVSLDFTGMSEEDLLAAGLPSGIFDEPVEIYYGLGDDDYFIFSTYTGLDEDFGTTTSVADSEQIKEAMKYLEGYPYQITYMSVEEGVKYAEKFVELMEKVQGPSPDDVDKAFDKVKEYLAPVKYLVGANKKVENIAEGMMFIRIEEVDEAVVEE